VMRWIAQLRSRRHRHARSTHRAPETADDLAHRSHHRAVDGPPKMITAFPNDLLMRLTSGSLFPCVIWPRRREQTLPIGGRPIAAICSGGVTNTTVASNSDGSAATHKIRLRGRDKTGHSTYSNPLQVTVAAGPN
jgi:hypothetical protein